MLLGSTILILFLEYIFFISAAKSFILVKILTYSILLSVSPAKLVGVAFFFLISVVKCDGYYIFA